MERYQKYRICQLFLSPFIGINGISSLYDKRNVQIEVPRVKNGGRFFNEWIDPILRIKEKIIDYLFRPRPRPPPTRPQPPPTYPPPPQPPPPPPPTQPECPEGEIRDGGECVPCEELSLCEYDSGYMDT